VKSQVTPYHPGQHGRVRFRLLIGSIIRVRGFRFPDDRICHEDGDAMVSFSWFCAERGSRGKR